MTVIGRGSQCMYQPRKNAYKAGELQLAHVHVRRRYLHRLRVHLGGIDNQTSSLLSYK